MKSTLYCVFEDVELPSTYIIIYNPEFFHFLVITCVNLASTQECIILNVLICCRCRHEFQDTGTYAEILLQELSKITQDFSVRHLLHVGTGIYTSFIIGTYVSMQSTHV